MSCKDKTDKSTDLSKYMEISKSLNSTETEITAAATPDEIQRANTILKAKLVDLNKQLLTITKNLMGTNGNVKDTSTVSLDEDEKKLDKIIKDLKELDNSYQLESSRDYTRKTQVANIYHDKHVLKYWYYAFGFLNFLLIMILVIFIVKMNQ